MVFLLVFTLFSPLGSLFGSLLVFPLVPRCIFQLSSLLDSQLGSHLGFPV